MICLIQDTLTHIAERYDPDELVDMLNLSSHDLVAKFEEEVLAGIRKGYFPEVADE